MTRVLGLETSCDDTSAAVVEDGRVLSSVVSSQVARHRPFRGVVPELASRAHLENLPEVVSRALAGAGPGKISAVAYARGPGLMGSLLVGRVAAETIARAWQVPLVPVNHLEAHALAAGLDGPLRWPAACLVVSGGHTDLLLLAGPGRYRVLGRTRDDAAGEAYDKVARLLGLGYPGGPLIDRLAARGDPEAEPFPLPLLPGSWDFSFSGLKTAALYRLRDRGGKPPRGRALADFCAGFQEAVARTLARRLLDAAVRFGAREAVLGGGVAANSRLRELVRRGARKAGLRARLPPPSRCTDNAAMIAYAGLLRLRAGAAAGPRRPDPSLPVRSWRR